MCFFSGDESLKVGALFGSAQPKSRLHTSHLNDIIHAPHQSRAVSNLHQPTYCKIFCVRQYAKKSALNTPQSATVLFFNISEVSRWRTHYVECCFAPLSPPAAWIFSLRETERFCARWRHTHDVTCWWAELMAREVPTAHACCSLV